MKYDCGVVSGFLSSWVYVVDSTGSSVMLTPRFVFHWFWNHSRRVLFRALELYVSLTLAIAACAAGVAWASEAFAAVTSNFWNVSLPSKPGRPSEMNDVDGLPIFWTSVMYAARSNDFAKAMRTFLSSNGAFVVLKPM